MKSQYFHFQFLSQGQTNIYQFIATNKNNLPYRDTFNYLPLTYFTFGTVNAALKPFMPTDFTTWINNWSATQNNYQNLPLFLLLLKIPYLLLDLGIAYLLYQISKSPKILYIWLLNPLSFYLIYILGNFDILPVFLTLLSLYLLKSKTNLSLILFGLAIALKLYPLIFLPFYLFSISKKPLVVIKNSIIALLPLILTIIPFINSPPFWQSFFGSGLTQKIIELKYFNIPIFPVIYLSIILQSYFSNSKDLAKNIFYLFLLFISTVNFHPQWLLWFLPFIFLLKNFSHKKFIIPFIFLNILIFIYIFLINDNYLFWGHLITLDPEFISLSSPYEIIRYKFLIDPSLIQNQIKNLIALSSLLFFVFYEKKSLTHQC